MYGWFGCMSSYYVTYIFIAVFRKETQNKLMCMWWYKVETKQEILLKLGMVGIGQIGNQSENIQSWFLFYQWYKGLIFEQEGGLIEA